jgi:hypothetical protein
MLGQATAKSTIKLLDPKSSNNHNKLLKIIEVWLFYQFSQVMQQLPGLIKYNPIRL